MSERANASGRARKGRTAKRKPKKEIGLVDSDLFNSADEERATLVERIMVCYEPLSGVMVDGHSTSEAYQGSVGVPKGSSRRSSGDESAGSSSGNSGSDVEGSTSSLKAKGPGIVRLGSQWAAYQDSEEGTLNYQVDISKDQRLVRTSVDELHASGTLGPVVYWCWRDQRVSDNAALVVAQDLADTYEVPLVVLHVVDTHDPYCTRRSFDFSMRGMREVEESLLRHNIPLRLLRAAEEGDVARQVTEFVRANACSILVTDMSPMRSFLEARNQVCAQLAADEAMVNMYTVDAHNVVPVWTASNKQEYAAHTFRPKLMKHVPHFLAYMLVSVHKRAEDNVYIGTAHPLSPWHKQHDASQPVDWDVVLAHTEGVDDSVPPVDWTQPGEKEAKNTLRAFFKLRIRGYPSDRNNPNVDGCANISHYLHFGQLSPLRACLMSVKFRKRFKRAVDNFMEQTLVRRELAENFCFYQPKYDQIEAISSWALETLRRHQDDVRECDYTLSEYEHWQSHDELWNAAQVQLVDKGKPHGYMRMYWCKKILEWSRTPERALEVSHHLNNKYALDSPDPNGMVGVLWCIGGIHDREFVERPVTGKIRYMSYDGCKRKFDVECYVRMVTEGASCMDENGDDEGEDDEDSGDDSSGMEDEDHDQGMAEVDDENGSSIRKREGGSEHKASGMGNDVVAASSSSLYRKTRVEKAAARASSPASNASTGSTSSSADSHERRTHELLDKHSLELATSEQGWETLEQLRAQLGKGKQKLGKQGMVELPGENTFVSGTQDRVHHVASEHGQHQWERE